MSVLRKLSGVAVALGLWFVAAVGVASIRSAVDDNLVPDRHVSMLPAEFAGLAWNMDMAPLPLVLDYADPVAATPNMPVVRLNRVYKDMNTLRWVELDINIGGVVNTMMLPYERTSIVVGDKAGVKFTFVSDEMVDVPQVGLGYSLGRLLTFQGAERYEYQKQFDERFGDKVGQWKFIRFYTERTLIIIPNDPKWLKAVAV
jgi:hypothetical protein